MMGQHVLLESVAPVELLGAKLALDPRLFVPAL